MPVRWTDDHCHLGWDGDGPADPILVDRMVDDAQGAGVDRLITVGTDRARSADAVAAAARHPGLVWATVGLHPHDAKDGLAGLADLLGEPGVVAVGESGLDYHYDHSPRDVQRRAFADQVGLAHEHDLDLVIHTREAWDDTFAVLDAEGVPERTVFHCFTGGPDEARRALDAGAHLSFSGIVTFKTAGDIREAAALTPLERILVETDAPYLTPVPHRGTPNGPAFVALVGAAVAAAKGVPVEEIEAATWANTAALFGLPTGE